LRGPATTAATHSPAPPQGPAPGGPYGFGVGLGAQLRPGDCVFALWSGEKLASTPKLSLTGCSKDSPDGQVLASPAVTAVAEAKAACERETAAVVGKLAEGVSYALPPSAEAWDRGLRNVACLVFSRSGAGIGGPLGAFRKRGESLLLQNAQLGDCTDYAKDKQGNELMHLLDCNRTHRQQIVGFVRTDDRKKGWDLCMKQYKAAWIRDDSMTLNSWTPGDTTFEAGFHFALCALVRTRAPDLSQPIAPKTN
ncbi:MAG: hypothetical protein HOY71_11970, partial [Nonomuraea sp.]|nr:hypothetical protein [Nonomuraea sp.]